MKFSKFRLVFTKYFLSPLIVFSVFLSSVVFSASAVQFTDVSRSAHGAYYNAIYWIADNGFMNGTSSTTFEPNTMVSRAMFVTVLYRFAGSPPVNSSTPFTDVPSNAYYYNAVRWGYSEGIINGVTATTFAPGSTVTREQAFTLLYKYHCNYLNKTSYRFGSITNAADYSSLSEYARDATLWAVSNGILVLSQNAPTIYPQAGVYRKELALWFCRYSAYAEGLTDKERYSFENDTPQFVSGSNIKICMSSTHKNLLYNLATPAEEVEIADMMTEWKGACFGMSLTCALDQLGFINFNSSFANTTNMKTIPSPKSTSSSLHKRTTNYENGIVITEAESAINFYSVLQNLLSDTDLQNYGGLCIRNSSGTGFSGLNAFVTETRTSSLTLFGFQYREDGFPKGHAILLFGPPTIKGSYIQYNAYDPNLTSLTTFRVASDFSSYSIASKPNIDVRDAFYITDFNFITDFGYDLDGNYNTTATVGNTNELLSTSLNSEEINEDNPISAEKAVSKPDVWLKITLNSGDYTITNKEGQSISITDGIVSGTMPILQRSFYGETSVTQCFKVPYSESFAFHATNAVDKNAFRVCWDEQFSNAIGTGISEAVITTSQIQLSGENMDYKIQYSFGEGVESMATVTGIGENLLNFEHNDSEFSVVGSNSAELQIESLQTHTVLLTETLSANSTQAVCFK